MVSDPLHIRVRDIPEQGARIDVDLPSDLFADALGGEETELTHDGGHIDVELHRAGDHVDVRGHLGGALELRCSRCLAPARVAFDETLHVTFTPPFGREGGEGGQDPLEDLEYGTLTQVKGEWILDLREYVREQLVLEVPIQPLCREACAGLCARCGADLNQGPCGCPPEVPVDPRFAALAALRDKLT